MKKSLNSFEKILLLLLPVIVFFSYYPVIKLGEDDSMNFELSLPLIWLAIFGVISLIKLPEICKKMGLIKSIVAFIFPIYSLLAIIWSDNKIRGILTAGIIWLIVFSLLNILHSKLDKVFLRKILKIFLLSATVVASICILQCILNVFGVSRNITLLCAGCTYTTLGFPHPNGFAIEPQFMGNLLIAPALISLGLFYDAIKTNKNKRTMFGYGCLSLFLIMSLYICFSRGALYAFGVAGIVFGIALIIRDKSAQPLWLIAPALVGCMLGLLCQGIFAEISPTSENFVQGIQRSIHQITLGKIDIREKTDDSGEQSSFSGYIEESTNIRLNITDTAIKTWKSNNIWLGVGLGSAGTAMNNYLGGDNKKEIIQNEYINILVELGIIGVAVLIVIFIYLLGYYLHNLKFKKDKNFILAFISLIFVYLIFVFPGVDIILKSNKLDD